MTYCAKAQMFTSHYVKEVSLAKFFVIGLRKKIRREASSGNVRLAPIILGTVLLIHHRARIHPRKH